MIETMVSRGTTLLSSRTALTLRPSCPCVTPALASSAGIRVSWPLTPSMSVARPSDVEQRDAVRYPSHARRERRSVATFGAGGTARFS
jgi:hypothetical protein